jgi:hypothetical protein
MVTAPDIHGVPERQFSHKLGMASFDNRVVFLYFAPVEGYLNRLRVLIRRLMIGLHTDTVNAARICPGLRAV